MKRPRKPKMQKYPKVPSAKASLATLKNYARRCADVDKNNQRKVSEYNRKISEIAQAKTLRQSLIGRKSRGSKRFHLKVA